MLYTGGFDLANYYPYGWSIISQFDAPGNLKAFPEIFFRPQHPVIQKE